MDYTTPHVLYITTCTEPHHVYCTGPHVLYNTTCSVQHHVHYTEKIQIEEIQVDKINYINLALYDCK